MRMTRWLLGCGVAAGPLFTVVYLVEGALRADYRPRRHPVSALAIGERGYRASAVGSERVRRHAHRIWESLSEGERLRRSRRNFDRMYRRFHGRVALVAGST